MEVFYDALMIIGAFILIFGLFSLFIKEKCYISETLVATAVGMISGRDGLKRISLDAEAGERMMFQFSRIVISLQAIAVGMVVSRDYVLRSVRSIAVLLLPVMVFSWVISTAIVYFLSDLGLEYSMIVGACVTPTDPVLASTILKGKFANRYVPVHLRKLLTFESGANDGLGLPLLNLPIYLLAFKREARKVFEEMLFRTFVFEIGLSILVGVTSGLVFRYLLIKSKKKNMIDKESFLAYTIALAFFVTGTTALMGVDDIFACFICGVFFSWYDEDSIEEVKESHLLEVIDMLINLSFFVLFGATFSCKTLNVWSILASLMVILFRRIPVILALRSAIDQVYNTKEALFVGWFGPIGVGAIFLAYHAKESLRPHLKEGGFPPCVIDLVHLITLSSVFIHGITVPVVHIHMRSKKTKKKRGHLYESSEYSETENTGANSYVDTASF